MLDFCGQRMLHQLIVFENVVPRTENESLIGRASLARENEAGGSWGQEVHILHVNI